MNKDSHPIKFPYYEYDSEKYSKFMICIMNSLESRFIVPYQTIASEMDESNEINFVL